MHPTRPTMQRFGGFGSGSPPPRDVLILIAVVFVTFSFQFFDTTAGLIQWLRLTPNAWASGFVWQVVTYPFVGYGPASVWILLELLILFWFAKDVFWRLGQKNFWKMMLWATISGGVVALGVNCLDYLLTGSLEAQDLLLLQGQRILLTVVIAAFSTMFAQATILLFFVLPVQARWFLWIELAIAFIGFLGTQDLAGFLGICTAVGVTWVLLSGGLDVRNIRRRFRDAWLKLQYRWYRRKLDRAHQKKRSERNFRVIPGEGKSKPSKPGDEDDDSDDDGNGRVYPGPWDVN